MDLHQYLQAMRKFWPVILIPALLGGLSGLYSASQAVTKYRASVTFFIGTSGDDTASGQVQGDEFAQRRVNSYIELATTDRLAELVADRSEVDLSSDQIQGMLGASGDLDTVLLTATVTSTSPSVAQSVADAVAVEFVDLVEDVEGNGESPASVRLEVVSGPSVKELPGQGKLMTALRAFVGLIAGTGLALLLELRDNAVRTEEHLRGADAGPVLGRIPFDRRVRAFPLIVEADHRSGLAESFRQLRTNLQFIDVELPVQVLVITSSLAAEGKSVVVSNLGLSLSAANRRVLVIEADLRRPTLSDHFGIPRNRGLTDVIAGHAEVEDVMQHWVQDGLSILPSGPLPPNPSELLGSAAMRSLIQRLRSHFDVIIIDTPPLLPVTDGAVAASWADGVALVVRTGRVSRQQVAHSVHALQAVNARILGVVMTMSPTGRGSGYETYERGDAVDGGPLRRTLSGLARRLHLEEDEPPVNEMATHRQLEPEPPPPELDPQEPPPPSGRVPAPVKGRPPARRRKPPRSPNGPAARPPGDEGDPRGGDKDRPSSLPSETRRAGPTAPPPPTGPSGTEGRADDRSAVRAGGSAAQSTVVTSEPAAAEPTDGVATEPEPPTGNGEDQGPAEQEA